MPRDPQGNFHLNTQRMMAHGGKGAASASDHAKPEHDADGKPEAHEPGSIHDHLAQMHAHDGGKHVHAHEKPGGGYESHQVSHDGQVEGPHDHENIESLKDHLGRFFNEEENESTDNHDQEHDGPEPDYA